MWALAFCSESAVCLLLGVVWLRAGLSEYEVAGENRLL